MTGELLGREDVGEFLRGLQRSLEEKVGEVQENPSISGEEAFIEKFVVPHLYEYVEAHPGALDGRGRREVIRAESRASREKYRLPKVGCSLGHPFTKVMGVRPAKLFGLWRAGAKKSAGFQACPDLALGPPYKIVFECKYFKSDAESLPRETLVEYLYQAFFYRALPRREAARGRPEWDYEYGCLLAYDATRNRRLVRAWETVREGIEGGFWNAGNIFVMILPSGSRTGT
jgi:hypothetical protein